MKQHRSPCVTGLWLRGDCAYRCHYHILEGVQEKSYVLSLAKSSIGYLSVISGPADVMGENIQLMQNAIGRSRRCDISFDERSLDKTHAKHIQGASGAVYLSRSGKGEVTVNGCAIESRAWLHSKDTVCLAMGDKSASERGRLNGI